ncbi:MAG: HD domain-containing phosphohydrolase [Bilophila wadsworthia]
MGYPKKPVVLVVDDTIANIRILDDLLRGEYTVRVATNGATALRLALRAPPRHRPFGYHDADMDSCNLPPQVDPHEQHRVVFITAMGNEEHEAKGLDLGAVDFIAKPFQPRLVRARVSNHVALKKYNDELNSLVKERTKELYLSRSVTVECLASVVETRDNETGAHVRRTQHGVEILAKRLRLMRPDIWDDDDDTIELFRVCAPLHDVGKVGIPDSILRKPGKLTEAEFNEMKKHTTLGYQTLSWAEKRMGGHNDFLRLGAVIAYTHHERWDGKGYPRGLKGEEIPRVGRLMALADVYDALISKRVYKPAFDHETARNIIVEGRGTQFDPLVVEAFLFEEDAFRSLIVTYPDDENPLLVSND